MLISSSKGCRISPTNHKITPVKLQYFDWLRATARFTITKRAVLPDWAGCRPIGLLLIGLDRRITHWAGRPNLGCF